MINSEFCHVKPEQLRDNFFDKIGKEWMLITAKDKDIGKYNTMTASWGMIGIMWGKPVLTCVVRPHRYTHEFTETTDIATFTFFDEKYRSALQFCGTKTGRDYDKIKECGLTPCDDIDGAIYYNEANLVIVGKKMYADKYKEENFIDSSAAKQWYPSKDYHTVYIYEITDVLIKEDK